MTLLISLIAICGMILACAGFGLIALQVSGADRYLQSAVERAMAGFNLGIGILGWLLFFPGVLASFSPVIFWAAIVIGVAAFLYRLTSLKGIADRQPLNTLDALLYLVLAVIAGFDLLEAVAPAADADSLAYHFALPRDFIADGQISFVPRAVSGAIPLLVHMTYAAALSTGGELTLTFWTAVTGWAPALLLYALVRRELNRTWSLTLLALCLTTPAVLYGGGSGQIEIRCAAFALAAVMFLLIANKEASYRILALAGIATGFFIASKYYGLIFAGAIGLVVIVHHDGFKRSLVFSTAAIVTGFQWYLWNYIHTGDPVFPMLTNLLHFPDTPYWNSDFGKYFSDALARGELPLERSFLNWALYPVYSIFNLIERLEGGRTGLGVVSILILPAAVIGILRTKDSRRELLIPLVIAAVFFTVWFFSGTTQRTRHLLPVYPLILLVMFPAAVRLVQQFHLIWPFTAGMAAALIIQLAGHGLFTLNYARHAFGPESRTGFLDRNVPGANAAYWINEHLADDAKIGFMNRQLAYLIKIHAFMIHPHIQVVVDARPQTNDAKMFVSQIKRKGLTHLLLSGNWGRPGEAGIRTVPFFDMIGGLVEEGCLKGIQKFDTFQLPSRTLSGFGGTINQTEDWVFEIVYPKCPAVS